MTPEALAALHARAFTDTPRPWTAAEFAALLAEPATILVTRPAGFAPRPRRRTGGGAPDPRRRSRRAAARVGARARRRAFEAAAAARGAEEALLEVAVTNAAARALYTALGYAQAGRRRGYYVRAGGAAARCAYPHEASRARE